MSDPRKATPHGKNGFDGTGDDNGNPKPASYSTPWPDAIRRQQTPLPQPADTSGGSKSNPTLYWNPATASVTPPSAASYRARTPESLNKGKDSEGDNLTRKLHPTETVEDIPIDQPSSVADFAAEETAYTTRAMAFLPLLEDEVNQAFRSLRTRVDAPSYTFSYDASGRSVLLMYEQAKGYDKIRVSESSADHRLLFELVRYSDNMVIDGEQVPHIDVFSEPSGMAIKLSQHYPETWITLKEASGYLKETHQYPLVKSQLLVLAPMNDELEKHLQFRGL